MMSQESACSVEGVSAAIITMWRSCQDDIANLNFAELKNAALLSLLFFRISSISFWQNIPVVICFKYIENLIRNRKRSFEAQRVVKPHNYDPICFSNQDILKTRMGLDHSIRSQLWGFTVSLTKALLRLANQDSNKRLYYSTSTIELIYTSATQSSTLGFNSAVFFSPHRTAYTLFPEL